MDIDNELKTQLKENRLRELQGRYFNLLMDKESLIANGGDTAETDERLEAVQKAYKAVENMT